MAAVDSAQCLQPLLPKPPLTRLADLAPRQAAVRALRRARSAPPTSPRVPHPAGAPGSWPLCVQQRLPRRQSLPARVLQQRQQQEGAVCRRAPLASVRGRQPGTADARVPAAQPASDAALRCPQQQGQQQQRCRSGPQPPRRDSLPPPPPPPPPPQLQQPQSAPQQLPQRGGDVVPQRAGAGPCPVPLRGPAAAPVPAPSGEPPAAPPRPRSGSVGQRRVAFADGPPHGRPQVAAAAPPPIGGPGASCIAGEPHPAPPASAEGVPGVLPVPEAALVRVGPFWSPGGTLALAGDDHFPLAHVQRAADEWRAQKCAELSPREWGRLKRTITLTVLPSGLKPRRWAVLPGLLVDGVPQLALVRVLCKLRGCADLWPPPGAAADSQPPAPVPTHLRLGMEDFRALLLAEELTAHWRSRAEDPEVRKVAPFFRPLTAAVAAAAGQCALRERFSSSFRPGDVLFYDLRARELVHETEFENCVDRTLFRLQRRYDRFSHSGVFAWLDSPTGRMPVVLHSLRGKVRVLRYSTSWACLTKREPDFSQILGEQPSAYAALPERERAVLQARYEDAAQRQLAQHHQLLNPSAGMCAMGRIAACGAADAAGLCSQCCRRPRRLGGGEAVICSGFTAGVLAACFDELVMGLEEAALEYETEAQRRVAAARGGTPAEQAAAEAEGRRLRASARACRRCACVRAAVRARNPLLFTPRDLHRWPVWRSGCSRPPGVLSVASAEVAEGFSAIHTHYGTDGRPPRPARLPQEPQPPAAQGPEPAAETGCSSLWGSRLRLLQSGFCALLPQRITGHRHGRKAGWRPGRRRRLSNCDLGCCRY
eukprot:TRINITY_DN12999_c0_g2_i4.p1 TRINITY_DN12999_c0_g2~~TRINITY_DN12999_c0_g2_i4.p1  ORF type:complete len:859 (+),score=203.45 TRINITY_DN12999_c0_g2_i4:109-2577(+)